MIVIGPNTKIAAILKEKPEAIEIIASISSHFEKLRNPLFRKVFAPRVTVAEAAKIGKCNVADILNSVKRLGFDIDSTDKNEINGQTNKKQKYQKITFDEQLDVRDDILSGNDPFNLIQKRLRGLAAGETLLLINTFEPLPLIRILEKKGYKLKVQEAGISEIHTFITVPGKGIQNTNDELENEGRKNYDSIIGQYKDKVVAIDVRNLEMPWPMITILKELEKLPDGYALHVAHKKVPIYLLPQLKEKGYSYVIDETDGKIQLVIYRATENVKT